MKKAASAYARAATSKTGVLDCLKLHQYKFNDDIFKKITVLPDGKNHGLGFCTRLVWFYGRCVTKHCKTDVQLNSFSQSRHPI